MRIRFLVVLRIVRSMTILLISVLLVGILKARPFLALFTYLTNSLRSVKLLAKLLMTCFISI